MIKDSAQKQKAIRYCVATGLVPYLEVVVRYVAEIAEVEADISDVDVLGIRPAGLVPEQKIIFDCKTQNKIGAVSRALWAAGLMRLIEANQAYVVLSKAAPEGHRLAANEIGVRLTSEVLFDNFGALASPNYAVGATYLDQIECWTGVFQLAGSSANLEPLVRFLLHAGPLEKHSVSGFRSLLSKLRGAESEFDVDKRFHRVLWGFVVCEALRFLSDVAIKFNSVFDPAMKKEMFELLLRNYIWGGKEAYLLRKRLNSYIKASKTDDEATQLEFPGWDKFVELMRAFMDAPHLVSSGILPAKDLAIREVSSSLRATADARIRAELDSSSRARQFVMLTSRYLGSLSIHLKDLGDEFASRVASH